MHESKNFFSFRSYIKITERGGKFAPPVQIGLKKMIILILIDTWILSNINFWGGFCESATIKVVFRWPADLVCTMKKIFYWRIRPRARFAILINNCQVIVF